jgi:hypothetical protein
MLPGKKSYVLALLQQPYVQSDSASLSTLSTKKRENVKCETDQASVRGTEPHVVNVVGQHPCLITGAAGWVVVVLVGPSIYPLSGIKRIIRWSPARMVTSSKERTGEQPRSR